MSVWVVAAYPMHLAMACVDQRNETRDYVDAVSGLVLADSIQDSDYN